MRGIPFVSGLALLAIGLLGPAALADEEQDLRREVEKLRHEVHGLKTSMLENEIDTYLNDNEAWQGAQGGGALQGITINARLTIVNQNTIGYEGAPTGNFPDVGNAHSVSGDVDLDFDFQVTDNLNLFLYLTANDIAGTNLDVGGLLPIGPSSAVGIPTPGLGGFPGQFLPGLNRSTGLGVATMGGLDDGIGVNGAVGTDIGSITVYEAGIKHSFTIGDNKLHWEAGALDPRRRFLQNAVSDDENTSFLNNNFDDSPSIPWRTGSLVGSNTGRVQGIATIAGWHAWISFGDNKQYTINAGWFNTTGAFFERGTFMFQFAWKGEVNGREMNVRIMGFLDESLQDSSGDGSAGGGASWDWMVTDKIGLFVRIGVNGGDTQYSEFDGSLGVVFTGLIGSRPDDKLGIAVGFIQGNDEALFEIGGFAAGTQFQEDTEFTLEIYYAYMMEDGKLQITPHLMFVSDPGGGDGTAVGGSFFGDDALFILGIRIYVPF